MKGEQTLAQIIFHTKNLWESRARTYQECLNQIQDYIDSPNVDIGLTEYTNLSNLIKMALTMRTENEEPESVKTDKETGQ